MNLQTKAICGTFKRYEMMKGHIAYRNFNVKMLQATSEYRLNLYALIMFEQQGKMNNHMEKVGNTMEVLNNRKNNNKKNFTYGTQN